MSLPEQLQRIAEAAPLADVPVDTWARARRSRRRRQVLASAGVAAVVVLVGGLVTGLLGPLPHQQRPPFAGATSLGVPDHLYGVPERMTARDDGDGWLRDEVTGDLTVGTAAAAWLASDGLPVVVDASTGGYHLLDLPDFGGNNAMVSRGLAPATIALSRDGNQLAYSYAHFGSAAASEPIPSGVRVADLRTGAIRTFAVRGAEGTAVSSLTWSADGSWVAFTGLRLASWTAYSMGGGHPVAGRVSVADDEVEQRRLPDHESVAIAVADDGLVRIVGNGQRVRWDGRTSRATDLPGGTAVGGSATTTASGVAVGSAHDLTVQLIPDSGRGAALSAAGDLPPTAGGRAAVVGAVGEDLVVRTRTLDDSDGQLLLVTPDGSNTVVGSVEAAVSDSLTVATDLVTPGRPTVSRPAPRWPWSEERWAWAVGSAVAGVGALALLGAGWRRRRRARRAT